MPMQKQEIRKDAEFKQEHIIYNAGYQYLAKCWDDNAEKMIVDYHDISNLTIFSDLGLAEISANKGNHFYILIELKETSKGVTDISGYSNGYTGENQFPEWLAVLSECANDK